MSPLVARKTPPGHAQRFRIRLPTPGIKAFRNKSGSSSSGALITTSLACERQGKSALKQCNKTETMVNMQIKGLFRLKNLDEKMIRST